MRAHEFVQEKVAPDTVSSGFKDQQVINNDQWLVTGQGETKQYGDHTANVLHVRVVTNDNEQKVLAWADFLVKTRKQDGEQYLESAYTYVSPAYRGQGLAKIMYQYANSLGNDIQPSQMQTDMGKGMWSGLSKSIKQPPALPEPVKPEAKPNMWQRLKKAMVPA